MVNTRGPKLDFSVVFHFWWYDTLGEACDKSYPSQWLNSWVLVRLNDSRPRYVLQRKKNIPAETQRGETLGPNPQWNAWQLPGKSTQYTDIFAPENSKAVIHSLSVGVSTGCQKSSSNVELHLVLYSLSAVTDFFYIQWKLEQVVWHLFASQTLQTSKIQSEV